MVTFKKYVKRILEKGIIRGVRSELWGVMTDDGSTSTPAGWWSSDNLSGYTSVANGPVGAGGGINGQPLPDTESDNQAREFKKWNAIQKYK